MKNYKVKILPLLISTLLVMNSCISPPDNFVAPSFDATYAFPLTDTLFTLNDFIEDDSSFVVSDDPEKLGVLIYSTEEIIDPFYISEQLKIAAFSTHASNSIGTIRINDVPPLKTNIAISDWSPISGGGDVVFPEASSPIISNFNLIAEFESALFKSGDMEITIQNNLPVTTEFREFKIINSADGSIVAASPTSSPIITPPFESTTVLFDLSNATITNSLEVSTTIYTPGSGTDTVTISNTAGTGIEIALSNLIIESVTGKIAEQEPINIDDSFIIDDSTKVETIIFDKGSFQIVMNNYFDLDLNISFEITNLFDSYNNSYNNIFSLKRNEKNKIIEIPTLENWQIKTLTPGTPTNLLSYSVSVLIAPTDGIHTISSNDSVTVNINFSESFIAYAEGLIKPTKFDITTSDLNFDLGDFQNSFNFDSVFINTPSMVLDLASSVNFDIILNGLITGTSSNLSKELEIQLDLPALVDSKFDLNEFGFTEFINSFTTIGEIPEQFTLSGSGIVNPNYTVGSISKTDSVGGGFSFEVPFDLGISGGSLQDTISLFDSDFDEESIEAINSIELTIESLNKIPVNIILKGTVLDILNNPILDFPPSYSPNTFIEIEAPTVDENGNVISAEMTKQVILLKGVDAITFMQNPNIEFNFSLDTPPINSVAPVKFRNTDNIYFKIYGKIDYRINSN